MTNTARIKLAEAIESYVKAEIAYRTVNDYKALPSLRIHVDKELHKLNKACAALGIELEEGK